MLAMLESSSEKSEHANSYYGLVEQLLAVYDSEVKA